MNLSKDTNDSLARLTSYVQGYTKKVNVEDVKKVIGLVNNFTYEIDDLNEKVTEATKTIENLRFSLALYEDEGEDWSYEDSK
jgi:hypothetical protein